MTAMMPMATGTGPEIMNCQQTGRTVADLIRQLAAEAAVDGQVPLSELARIAKVVEAMTPIYELTYKRCHAEQMCRSIAFRRTQILGRIIAYPLEPLLFACPPVIERPMLSALFDTVRLVIGDSTYTALDERAKEVYFSMLKTYDYFEWPPFYADERVIGLFCEAFLLLARAFCVYDDTKRWFCAQMNAQLGGTDKNPLFGSSEFHTLFVALARPLQQGVGASPYRAHLEANMPRGACNTIDAFIDVLHSERKRAKKAEAVLKVINRP